MEYKKIQKNRAKLFLAALLTWLPIFVFIAFDLLMYPLLFVAFWATGIEMPSRKAHIQVIDRSKLQYLSSREKLGCMYCGYVNGIMEFYKEATNAAEKHWCAIIHESKKGFVPQEHQIKNDFAKFGDKKDFEEKFVK